MRARWWSLALLSSCVACQLRLVVPIEEDVARWGEHRTIVGEQVIVYKLPPSPRVRVYPKRVAELPTSIREPTSFAVVSYGYELPDPEYAQLNVTMQIHPVAGGGIEERWTPQEFAEFYRSRLFACEEAGHPSVHPALSPWIFMDSRDYGETTWLLMAYVDAVRDRVATDVFVRPISTTHVLSVSGIYWDYGHMLPAEIEDRRALMRKIVSEIRVEPPFGQR